MSTDLRNFALIVAGLLSLFLFSCQTPVPPEKLNRATPSRPDIYLITIDTIRADYVGTYGGHVPTPTLDGIAGDGTRFTGAISEVPLTLPAHASLLTGSYPLTTGVHDNLGYYLDENFNTVAERLHRAGYRTSAFVGSYVLSSKWGLNQGFEVYQDRFKSPLPGETSTEGIERRAEEVIELALEWIRGTNSRKPRFCWIHLFDPHDPYDPPEPFQSRYADDPYAGEVAYVDLALGELIQILKEAESYDDSLIIVAGDHGESLGAHGEPTHGFFLYEETLHIPLIIKLPRSRGVPERVVDGTVQLVDIAPTIFQIAELERFDDLQGKGLLGAMLGKESLVGRPAYSETYYPNQFGWNGLRSWRVYPHKYVLAPRPELYDLSQDPAETTNIATENSSLVGRFREDLLTFEARHRRKQQESARRDLSPADLERFASLGYIGAVAGVSTQGEETWPDPKDRIEEYLSINRAMAELAEKNYQGAHRALSGFTTATESDTVRFLRGQAYFGLNRYQDAARELKAVVSNEGSNAYARFYLARTYLATGETKLAEQLLVELVEKDRMFSPAYNHLGLIYSDQGRIDEAIDAFSKAVAIHEDAHAYQMLGYLYTRKGQPELAARSLERTISLDPNNALAHLYLANAYHLLGDDQRAKGAYEAAFKLDPSLREKLQ